MKSLTDEPRFSEWQKGRKSASSLEKPSRGRPVEKTLPDPVPTFPEDLARAIMPEPPKRKLRHSERVDG